MRTDFALWSATAIVLALGCASTAGWDHWERSGIGREFAGETELARGDFQRTLEIAEGLERADLRIASLDLLTHLESQAENWQSAGEYARMALAVREETNAGSLEIVHNLSWLRSSLVHQGRMDEAREMHQRTLDLVKTVEHKGAPLAGDAHAVFASELLDAGHPALAIAAFERSFEVEGRNSNTWGVAVVGKLDHLALVVVLASNGLPWQRGAHISPSL